MLLNTHIVRTLLALLLISCCAGQLSAQANKDQKVLNGPTPEEYGNIAKVVSEVFEILHFSQRRMDKQMSREILDTYLDQLDSNKFYFLQADIDNIRQSYGNTLDISLKYRDLTPAHKIFSTFKERTKNRLTWAVDYLYSISDKDIQVNETKPSDTDTKNEYTTWAQTNEEANNRVKKTLSEMLAKAKADGTLEDALKTAIAKHESAIARLDSYTPGDTSKQFINSIAKTFDPHSSYLGVEEVRNFNTAMNLTLVGVGAALEQKEGKTIINSISPGSPAELSGELKEGDTIVSVGEKNAEPVNIDNKSLREVINLMRGKEGTEVTLKVISKDSSDEKEVKLIRREIALSNKEAKAQIYEAKRENTTPVKVGYIYLPTFYSSKATASAGQSESNRRSRSASVDVMFLLRALKTQGVNSVVIDLRHDGGGALDEAVNLAGLFIKSGPIVQALDSKGRLTVFSDTDPTVVFDGPIVVLTNRQSASASEIFAGAIQDYRRGIIVGEDKTYGKGTVQKVIGMSSLIALANGTKPSEIKSIDENTSDSGAIKITIQQFFRVNGESTQIKGIVPDINISEKETGQQTTEAEERNAIAYKEIAPVEIDAGDPNTIEYLIDLAKKRKTTKTQQTSIELLQELTVDDALNLALKANADVPEIRNTPELNKDIMKLEGINVLLDAELEAKNAEANKVTVSE